MDEGGNAVLPKDVLHIWLYVWEGLYLLGHRDQGYVLGYPAEFESNSVGGLW